MTRNSKRVRTFFAAFLFALTALVAFGGNANAANLPAGCNAFNPCVWVDHGSYYEASQTVAVGDYLAFPAGTAHDIEAYTASVCDSLSFLYAPEYGGFLGWDTFACTATSAGTIQVKDYGPYDVDGNDTATTADFAPYSTSGVTFASAPAPSSNGPLGAFTLMSDATSMFTGMVIPACLTLIAAVYMFACLLKLSSRYFTRTL